MKIQNLLLCFLAAGALFVGCGPKEEPQPSTPMLNVSPTDVKFEQGGGSVAVSVTSNRPWSIETDADWLNFSPADGKASDAAVSVNVSALANSGNDRTASFKVKTEFDFRTITVTQPGAKGEDTTDKPSGDGSKDNPYNPAGVVAYISTLAADTESPNVVYVTGKISEVGTTYEASGTYGNATFYMSEDGSKSLTQFYVFQTYYLGNKKWKSGQTDVKVGDVVTVCGKVTNYKGNTPETVGKGASYVCTLNDKTEYGDGGQGGEQPEAKGKGTLDDPYNPSAAANAVANLTWTDKDNYQTTGEVYVKGKISRIADKGTYTEGGQYGNASFYIVEEGTEFEFYVFRALYLGNKKFESGQTDIKVGDEVIICGKLMNYQGKTPETVAGGAYLYSLNGETGGGQAAEKPEAKGKGTLEDPYNPSAAADAVANLTWTDKDNYQTTDEVYVKGKISRIADKGTYTEGGQYGNASFYIVEEGTEFEFYVFRALYLGNKKFESGQTDIKVGDEVIICGKLMNYQGKTPETEANKSYIYSLNGKTEAGEGGGGEQGGEPGEPKGTGTLNDPYNPAAAAAAVANLTWTDKDNYQTTDEVYVKGKISRIASKGTFTEGGDYGNASFFIVEEGSDFEFQIFRTLYLGNKKFESGQTDIKVGDDVIICGKLMNYQGKTPETEANKSYIYSLNGKTEAGEGGGGEQGGEPGVPKGTGTLNDPYNPAAAAAAVTNLTWTSNTEYQTTEEVYVKGKISKIANKGTFTEGGDYGNASFFIVEEGSDFEFQVFRTLYLGNKKFESGQTDIKVGDEVVICGKLMNYKGNTPETEANKSYIYSLNGKTEDEGGQGGGGQGGGETVSGNTVVFSSLNIENGKQYNGSGDDKTIVKASDFSVFFGKGGNDGKYYNTGTGIRTYGNGYIRIESTKTITKIVYTFQEAKDSDGRPTYPSGTDYTLDTGSLSINKAVATWTGSAKSVKLTRPTGSGHWRLQKVEVTFAE